MGSCWKMRAWNSWVASDETLAPGSSMLLTLKGVQPMAGSTKSAIKASSEALSISVAVGNLAWLAAVNWTVLPSESRRYLVGRLSDWS